MDLNAIRGLKNEIVDQVIAKRFGGTSGEILAQNMIGQPAANGVAVGFSRTAEEAYRLEFRVQKKDRQGHILAQSGAEHARKQGVEANIEIIPEIRIPTLASISEAPHETPVVKPGGKLEIGMSIGHKDTGAGTLGAFVEKIDGIYLLSCSHVIALSGAIAISADNPSYVYHPGKSKGNTIKGSQRVAKLTDFTELSKADNEIDAAIAKILPEWEQDGNLIPLGRGHQHEGKKITLFNSEQPLYRDREIAKIGRSSGYTTGLFRAMELDFIRVEYSFPQSKQGTSLFNNLTEIRWKSPDQPFSMPGDSGSLAFTDDTQQAIGLVFAGGERADGQYVSYCIDLKSILSEFEAKLL